ncbi:hypothetical protein APHAL10511_005926 [Amanita phalloides]|nr:hypothetical protein APHAL10511_005926 [Amanita phalloides]
MNSRAHAFLVRSAGFCYGLAGFFLSVLSAILGTFVTIIKPPAKSRLHGSRQRSSIPTITMTGADSDSAVLYAEPLTYGDSPRRSSSSPQLTNAASFLRPPTPEKSRRRRLLRRVTSDQIRVRPRTPPNTC